MPYVQCPAGCLFPVPEPVASAWKAKLTQAACPRCKKVYPRNRFTAPNTSSEPLTRMPGRKTPLTPLQNATRVVQMTSAVARSTAGLPVGSTSSSVSMEDVVTARLQALTHSNAPDLLSRVCGQLIGASLTVNFPTRIIYDLLANPKLKNFWQVPREEGYDHEKYSHQREATELALHPLPPLAPVNLHMEGKPGLRPTDYGTDTHRPISAALNIGYFYGGAAPMYGTSYLVLRNAVKQRCTFTAGDSLEHHWKRGLYMTTVGTSDALVNVLYHMSEPALACVAGLALNISGPREGSFLQYVEAQIFGGIDMETDVRAMVIDEDELNHWVTAKHSVPKSFEGKDRVVRLQAVEVLKLMIQGFCTKHNIILEYINSGCGDTGAFSAEKVYKPARFRWQK